MNVASVWLVGLAWLALITSAAANPPDRPADDPGVVAREFIFESAPFAQCHASTIVEAERGLVAAWFGGTREGAIDVKVWVSRNDGSAWSPPQQAAVGADGGTQYPCWNPVLYQPAGSPLMLFYKVGPNPRRWWGLIKTSADGGLTWSAPRRLPDGILGPIKNKPVRLPDGALLCPSSTEDQGWRVHLEKTTDLGATWERIGPIQDDRAQGAIQPSVLTHADGRLQLLCRASRGRLVESWSSDGGRSWSALEPTALPNPNSGTDAVTLADGRQLLVYNPTQKGRSPLDVAISADGKTWKTAVRLESDPGEYSYPAVIQGHDGRVHVTYTWKRERIRHVVLDPGKLVGRDIAN